MTFTRDTSKYEDKETGRLKVWERLARQMLTQRKGRFMSGKGEFKAYIITVERSSHVDKKLKHVEDIIILHFIF